MSSDTVNHRPGGNPGAEDDDEEIGKQATRLAYGAVVPMTLRSAMELGAIDVIYDNGSGAFFSPSEIAQRLPRKPTNPNAPVLLDRLFRLLASFSVLKCRTGPDGRTYAAGPVCKFLIKDQGSGSVGPFLLFAHEKYTMESWYHLNDAILEGGIAFHRAHGMSPNEFYAKNPVLSAKFNDAMTSHSVLVMKKLLEVYDGFGGLKTVVDVGGSRGIAISLIVAKYPHIHGINFDLPHVVADAPPYPGVEHVGGDMFVSIPKADAIFLKWVLPAWSDEDSLKLLKNCREALPGKGKVIVVGSVLADEPKDDLQFNALPELDLIVLNRWLGGRERSHKEFHDLARKAGFSGSKAICSAYDAWIIEYYK